MPDVPWSEIIGMRHRIAHDYLNVKVERSWYTTTDDREPLIKMLEFVLPNEPPE